MREDQKRKWYKWFAMREDQKRKWYKWFAMREDQKRKWHKISAVLGTVILLLPNGVAMYWGNLSVYVLSYLVISVDSSYGVEAPWMINMFLLSWTISVMIYGPVRSCLGKRSVVLMGVAFTQIGIFISYLSVQVSYPLVIFTLGMVTGAGTGLLQAHALLILVHWADGDTGLIISILQGSFYWGASIINQIVTLYLNDTNASPNMIVGRMEYFAQRKIVDKVPSSFLVLGCFSAVSQTLGYLLLKENTGGFDSKEQTPISEEQQEQKFPKVNSFQMDIGHGYGHSNTETNSCYPMEETVHNEKNSLIQNDTKCSSITFSNDIGIDYTPKEMVKEVSFYVLWLIYFLSEYPIVVIASYYKLFGQLWIHDDYFLTALGTSLAFISVWMRILWGIVIDRIGVKACLIVDLFSIALISAWYYLTAFVDRWLFLVATLLFYSLIGAFFSSITIVVVFMYGKTHFSTNFGILRSSAVILSIVCPFVTDAILKGMGWFSLFAISAAMCTIALILIVFFVPRLR